MNSSSAQDRLIQAPPVYASLPKGVIVVGVVTYLLLCALLIMFLPPLPIVAHLLVLAAIWAVWRWPVGLIAFILVLTPFQPLPTLALKALGFDWAVALSSLKEVGMFSAVAVLAWRNRPRLGAVDFLLFSLLGWSILVSLTETNPSTWIGLKDDFDFMIPFYAGRLILLDDRWIKSGLWVAGFVAALGLLEFFVLGPTPRTLLLGLSDPSELISSYKATYFSGFRAAATFGSPLEFGAFCAIALIVLASLYRQLPRKYLIPALLLAGGLIVSLTRMAWLAVLIGLIVIAVRTGQKQRLLIGVGISAVVMLFVVVPLLQLEDFVSSTQKGYDPSLDSHSSSMKEGSSFVWSHPLGVGAGLVGPRATARNPSALTVESSFLQYGMAYGWLGLLLFTAFWVAILMKLWGNSSTRGVGVAAVAFGMCSMLLVSALNVEFALNSWVFAFLGCGMTEASAGDR